MTINHWMARLVEELRAEEVPDPLAQVFLLARTSDDLCRLAGEEPPAEVRAVLGDETAATGSAPRRQEPETEDGRRVLPALPRDSGPIGT